jgi:hypothetical protein
MYLRAYHGQIALEQTLRFCLRACFKINESKTNCFKTLLAKKAAEFSGVTQARHLSGCTPKA